jgi:carboxymethylenebutenolidase
MAMISIKAADGSGSFDAWVVEPAKTPTGAVVVIQEIFGINAAMRATCEQVADLGFIAICPDLFWRIEPGVDITDKTDAEWQKAFSLFQAFDQEKGIADLKTTLAAARDLPGCNGRAGTMGYCLGGLLAFKMAEQSDSDVNISYYGVGLDGLIDDLDKVRAKLVVHIAEEDKFFPPEGRAKVLSAVQGNPHIDAYSYAGADHAFARIGGIHWNGLAATIANGRSAAALAGALLAA